MSCAPRAACRAWAPVALASAPICRPSRAPSPCAHALTLLEVSRGPCAPPSTPYPAVCAPQTIGPSAALHCTRADRGRSYHGGISAVTATSPARRHYINVARPPSLVPTPPLHRAISASAAELRPHYFPRPCNHPCSFPRLHRTFLCRLLSRPSYSRRWSRAAAAGPRRAPTPATPPPQLRPAPGPRRACGWAPLPPRLGASPALRNPAGTAASPCRGPNCSAPNLSRVPTVN
jgi:hypothetical protein